MNTEEIATKFHKEGYITIENYLDNQSIDKIRKHVLELEPKVFDTFSKTPLARGWGNLVNDELVTNTIGLKELIKTAENITKKSMSCNLVMVNNKPRWVGRDFEFHQEIFNSSTFAAGADSNLVKDQWVQLYIALDDETPLNGGLCIFEGSHNFGILDYEDFVDGNFRHKRRVSALTLDELENKGCVLKPLNLKAGNLLIFSTYLVHASPNNLLSKDRMSLVLQFEPSNFNANKNIFEQESNFRSGFIQSTLSNILEKEISRGNAYKDVSSKK
tara:strand:- start:17 stop:835 length:819 start_codon:yes stop_codon:yes gene_type:complete